MKGIINMLKKNWYYIAGAVLLIVIVVVIRRKNRSQTVYSPISGQNQSSEPAKPVESGDTKAKFPLRPRSVAGSYSNDKGSMGSQIKTLQVIYNANNTSGTPLDVDGKYGSKTLGAFLGFFYDMISTNGTITEAQYNQIINKFDK